MSDTVADATRFLSDHAGGDPRAADRLMPLVYDDLRALANVYMKTEPLDHTLEPTALVHETYIRLIDITRVDWRGRSHFFAMAAKQMRRVLVDHARRRRREKRGGGLLRVSMNDAVAVTAGVEPDVLALHDALEKLARLSPRQSEVASLRFFGGLSEKETSHVLGVSERTIRQDWRVAKSWLHRELEGYESPA